MFIRFGVGTDFRRDDLFGQNQNTSERFSVCIERSRSPISISQRGLSYLILSQLVACGARLLRQGIRRSEIKTLAPLPRQFFRRTCQPILSNLNHRRHRVAPKPLRRHARGAASEDFQAASKPMEPEIRENPMVAFPLGGVGLGDCHQRRTTLASPRPSGVGPGSFPIAAESYDALRQKVTRKGRAEQKCYVGHGK